tara:strand:- start:2013 stop:2459 length:447 start_codon:yes stop_codon:yes gene_type:complete
MLNRTHLAIGFLAMIIFLPHVVNKGIFIGVLLFASVLPNIDEFLFGSKAGVIFRPFKFMINRHFIHSFTFCLLVAVFLAFYFPVFAFPFFLGYALHLLVDSWTKEGIKPFWPLKAESKGKVEVGGALEETIFMVFVILDIIFAIVYFV